MEETENRIRRLTNEFAEYEQKFESYVKYLNVMKILHALDEYVMCWCRVSWCRRAIKKGSEERLRGRHLESVKKTGLFRSERVLPVWQSRTDRNAGDDDDDEILDVVLVHQPSSLSAAKRLGGKQSREVDMSPALNVDLVDAVEGEETLSAEHLRKFKTMINQIFAKHREGVALLTENVLRKYHALVYKENTLTDQYQAMASEV
jgi:hypothetical protein